MNPLLNEAWRNIKPTADKLQGYNDQYKDFNNIQNTYGMPAAIGQNIFNRAIDMPNLNMDLLNDNWLKYTPEDTDRFSNMQFTMGPDTMQGGTPSGVRVGAKFNF